MGILDYLLAGLGKDAKKKLAQKAAEQAVRGVGDALYEKADEVRERVEEVARERREKREREEAERRRRAEKAAAEQQIEDELAALKAKIENGACASTPKTGTCERGARAGGRSPRDDKAR